MSKTSSNMVALGTTAPEFYLKDTNSNESFSFFDSKGEKGTLVMFICNHCPYVKAVLPRILRDCRELAGLGIGSVAIMSNDPAGYPEDSWDNMRHIAAEMNFPFP